MNRPALTARRVRGLRYLVKRLSASGRSARRAFGELPAERSAELVAALDYLEQLCQWHEGRPGTPRPSGGKCGACKTGVVCLLASGHDGAHEFTFKHTGVR